MDQGSRIGSIGLMMLLAMPGAQAQLPMDIVWQHAPWTFESGPNTISSALGVGLAPQYTRWTHHGTPSPQNLSTCSSLAYEQQFGFDPMGVPSMFPQECRLDEVTWAFLGGGGSVWSDMINTTNYIFVNGAYLPCSDSLWTGQFFRGLTERNGIRYIHGEADNCPFGNFGWGHTVWSLSSQWCACFDREIQGLALHGDTLLACHLPMVTRLHRYTGAVLDSITVFADTVTWGKVRTSGDTLFWLIKKPNLELWSGAYLLGGAELWRIQLPTTDPITGWEFDQHGRAWIATGSTFIRQERSDGTLQAYPVSEPILRIFERDGDIYWAGDLGPGNGYTIQCATPWP